MGFGFGPKGDQASLASVGKDLDKVAAIEVYEGNKYTHLSLSDEDAEFFDTFPEDKKKRMIRKIDFRLVPVLALLYLAAHIDRANIGNAKVRPYTVHERIQQGH